MERLEWVMLPVKGGQTMILKNKAGGRRPIVRTPHRSKRDPALPDPARH